MKRLPPSWLPLAAVLLMMPGGAFAVERSEIPAHLKWDTSHIFASKDAWKAEKERIEKAIPTLAEHQGHLGESADRLFRALDAYMKVAQDLSRLYVYASMTSDEDTRVAENRETKDVAANLYVQFGTATSWMRPELLEVGAEKIRGFVAADPRLAPYRPYLDDILRYAPHTLSAAEEKIVARTGQMAGAGGSVRDVFTNAELPYPEVTLSTGETVRLDAAAYTRLRQSPNRADRDLVFDAFWKAHDQFKGTLGAALNAQMQAHAFNKDVRKFGSSLEASLFGNNIPTTVYTQLVADVNANLPTFHRYLKLRRRMLGVDTLRYQDLYAPIVKSVDRTWTPEEAERVVLASLAPLGRAYVDTLRAGLRAGWVDWMPSTGKASGAYSTGVYGLHPYQLQNFTGKYDEVGTFTHEAGHSMHTFLSDTHQPYVTHDYATFVAEVASTLNENLLFHYMLDRTKDRDTRLFLLGSYLDNLRGTLFRQTQFAEFELKIHEMGDRGEPLSGDGLNALYLDITRRYYGHDLGVTRVDDLIAPEWAYIDHFFYDFYVYQYATSIIAATALANGIHDEAARKPKRFPKRDAYLRLLQSGSSKYPIDLLKDAGVDMTTSAPFAAAIREMNAVMDEMEKLLK